MTTRRAILILATLLTRGLQVVADKLNARVSGTEITGPHAVGLKLRSGK
jgi:hypothetical protein